ncbi:hypothetical protein [Paenibacillus urinalis]|uniref:Uncharacterized protein n=1 Tax=Paenibacillus urinalis TaxID=521520 RepID=A0AAX3N465_9BACL|nr:hypothetical protein [Paenibacillus urinalis]WDH84625.1 hypothetical protein PUW23_10600 [Paenibacillus urinalis]
MKNRLFTFVALGVILSGTLLYGNFNIGNSSTVLAKSEDVQDTTVQNETVYINDLTDLNGELHIKADEIKWYEGEEANTVFVEQEPDAGIDYAPDGYYIVNEQEASETLKIADDATVTVQIYDRTGDAKDIDIEWNEEISLDKFAELYGDTTNMDMSVFPYHLTIENGEVTQIVQQYIP